MDVDKYMSYNCKNKIELTIVVCFILMPWLLNNSVSGIEHNTAESYTCNIVHSFTK